MKKFLKFLLVMFVWLIISAVLIGGSILAGLSLETGVTIAIVTFVAWLIFLLARKIIINYRAKKKVEALVNVEEEKKNSWQFNFSFAKTPLQNNFTSMTKLLRKSYLKVHGDPMYVLPWYLIIGNSGSGKTHVLANANLPTPTIELSSLSDKDCGIDWTLYNQGIVIDTPGDYIGSEKSDDRNSDWLQLLGLLKKHRPKEPINGVIVTISMESLLSDNSHQLIETGIEARKNIEQLMQLLHVQVPVYVLVTHTDKLAGVNEWVQKLNVDLLKDPIGEVNNDELPVSTFIGNAIANISERLKQLLLLSIKDENVSSNLLLLPTKFEQLERDLSTFTETLFQTNPYQKTPFFRGLYFVGEAQNIAGESGLFSHRLLTEIIPNERDMVTSLASSEKIARTQRLGKAFVWNAFFVATIALLYWGFNSDSKVLASLVDNNAGDFEESAELSQNITSLYQYRDMVNSLHIHSWAPWFGVSGTPEFITKLEGMFSDRVQARLVEKTDMVFVRELANSFTRDAELSEEKIVAFISTLVRRINIIDAYLAGESNASLAEMPTPYSYSDAEFFGINNPEIVDRLNTLYLQSLAWTTDQNQIQQEGILLDAQLQDILVKSKDLSKWLIPWANKVASKNEVRVSDYWLTGSGQMNNEIVINGAFTVAGKETIDDFIEQIKATGRYDTILNTILPSFEGEFKKRYLSEWEGFAKNFATGSEKLNNRTEWLSVINNLSTGRNLYFNALNVVEQQIAPYKGDDELPDWARMVHFYQDMRAYAPDEKTDGGGSNKMFAKMALKVVGKAGPLGKALAGSGKKGMKTQKKMAKASGGSGPSADERQMQLEAAGKLLGEYRQSLADFVYSAEMRSVSHAAVANLYLNPDNPAKGESSLAMSYASLKNLQAIVGKESTDNKAFWNLYSGGINLMQEYMIAESACEVQNLWSDEFLTNLEGVPPYKIPNMAFGQEGLLWTFLDNQLAPFVNERFGAGYVAAKVKSDVYPIGANFLEFAARAKDGKQAKQDVYPVQLNTVPTSINLDSKFHVSQTSLQLQCAEGAKTLINKNFPNSSQFDWTESCSSVNLTIKVGRFTLEKKYSGELGFPKFLQDFQTGQKRFTADDFPRFAERLKESGISFFDIKYRMSGHGALLRSLDNKQLDIPRTISSCWKDNTNSSSVAAR